jgi:hypothetical protein
MLPRGITIAAAAAILSCAPAAPRGVQAAGEASLLLGVRNALEGQDEVHRVRILLDGEAIASLDSTGSGEEWTPALEQDETRVLTRPLPAAARVTIEVCALIGQEQVRQAQEIELPPRTVAVLATLLVEAGRPAIRIERVALSELQSDEKCIEPEPESTQPSC